MRVTDISLESEDSPGMPVGIDIGNESDGYRLTMGGHSVSPGRC